MLTTQFNQETSSDKPKLILGIALELDYRVVVRDDGRIHLLRMEGTQHRVEASQNLGVPIASAEVLETEYHIKIITVKGVEHELDLDAWLDKHLDSLSGSYSSDDDRSPKPVYRGPK